MIMHFGFFFILFLVVEYPSCCYALMLYDSGMDHRTPLLFTDTCMRTMMFQFMIKIDDCIMIAGDYECIDSLNSLSVNAISYSTLYGLHR